MAETLESMILRLRRIRAAIAAAELMAARHENPQLPNSFEAVVTMKLRQNGHQNADSNDVINNRLGVWVAANAKDLLAEIVANLKETERDLSQQMLVAAAKEARV